MRKTRSLLAIVVVALLFGVLAGDLRAQNVEVKTQTLKNGMKVMVHEDHSIPNVAMYIFYRIGARNERPGTTGISHFFEHMMFNGAKKYGPKQFDVVMEANGGSNNAYTSQDVTAYQDWFPRTALELIFDMEADRIANLSFDPKIVESERGVIGSERRLGVEGNNFGILSEQLWATAFTAHPYQWPVVGWMVDIENWKAEDLKHHFEMGYSPSNATMLVVGDITAEEVFKLAEKYIEPIAAHAPPPKVTTREPEQIGERRVTVKKFAQLPIVMMGYHVPESAHPDFYALRVLQTILFSGQSSRMYQRIVDKDQLALFINGGFSFSFDPTLFTISSQPKAGIDPAAIEKAVYEELEKVKNEAVSDQELEKAKNILLAGFYRSLKTISGKANTLGTYEVFFGDYRKLLSAAEDYNKVTKDDLQRVAKQYFTEKNRTVATLVPEKPAQAKP
jgi:zinc protease